MRFVLTAILPISHGLAFMAESNLQSRSKGEPLDLGFFRKMKHSGQLALFLLFLPSLCLAETGVQFLFPRDHISTSVPYFHMVGCSPDSQVIVELNGKVIASPAVQDSVFHVRISLPFGLNRVYVRPVGIGEGDTSMSAMLEVLCGPRISQSYTKLYVPNEFHGNSPRTACLVCHAREQIPLENSTGLDWCVSCHAETGQQFNKHVTNQEGDCNG